MADWLDVAMNGYTGGLADILSGSTDALLFVSLIMVLALGGWIAGIIATSGSGANQRFAGNGRRAFRGTYLNADRRGRAIRGVHEGGLSGRIVIKRRLVIEGLEGDVHGRIGERLLRVMAKGFGRGFLARLAGSKIMRGFEVVTGLGGLQRGAVRRSMSAPLPGKSANLKQAYEDGVCSVDITLSGHVEGRGVGLRLYPPGPVVQEFPVNAGSDFDEGFVDDEGFVPEEELSPFFDCFDFPLLQLKGLTLDIPQGQELLVTVAIGGVLGRGIGLDQQILSVKEFCRLGKQLSSRLENKKLTQPELHEEMIIGAGWCFLMAGLILEDLDKLKKALVLFGRADGDYWRGRDVSEWGGIKCNEAMAALALAQLHSGDVSRFYQRVQQAAIEGMRYFRRDNFPDSWGKLICKLALSHGNMGNLRCSVASGGEAEFSNALDYRPIVRWLDEAISLWALRGHEGAMCEAYYAKGRLAQNTAKLHMGVQDWERAENSFLAALALSDDVSGRFTCRRVLVHYELGQLYLGWGTRFGERELLEKAIHHFHAVQECARKGLDAGDLVLDTEFALAQCYLNFGGISNEDVHHKRAIFILNDLLDREGRGERVAELDRALCVARARLALNRRDNAEAKVAISAISAVIGQKNQSWPSADVLLRLRARLREMIFTLEGDDVALDRAIQDRRLLVASASEGLKDLRWAVEVGNLVGVLSQRQYKIDGQLQNFNEAHYYLEKAIAICEESLDEVGDADVSGCSDPTGVTDGELLNEACFRFNIPHIRAGLYLKLAKLLASFARVQFDEPALMEAVTGFDKFLLLTPRSINALARASALNDIGQIMMDRSEHYGHHDGLWRATKCFAEAHDIYLEAERMDQANRMRRFMENAEAAILAYQVPIGASRDGNSGADFILIDDEA